MESFDRERAPYGRQNKSAERTDLESLASPYRGQTYYGEPVVKRSPYGQLIASYCSSAVSLERARSSQPLPIGPVTAVIDSSLARAAICLSVVFLRGHFF